MCVCPHIVVLFVCVHAYTRVNTISEQSSVLIRVICAHNNVFQQVCIGDLVENSMKSVATAYRLCLDIGAEQMLTCLCLDIGEYLLCASAGRCSPRLDSAGRASPGLDFAGRVRCSPRLCLQSVGEHLSNVLASI